MKKYIYLFIFIGCLAGSLVEANVKTGDAAIDKMINDRFGTMVR